MGDSVMMCPLCCGKVFDSKPALIEHLRNTHENLSCPICHDRYSSLGNLIQHLGECEPDHENPGIQFSMVTDNINKECAVQTLGIVDSNILPVDDVQKDFCDTLTSTIANDSEEGSEINRMYVELLSKQLANPQLQKRELKLVNNNGVSQYIILTDDSPSISDGTAIVTKQNHDGTISMTTVDEMKLEEDSMAAQSQDSPETEEIYSCNTCGVSFTSVLEHIQNYHNNQDVVVEEPIEESNQNSETFEFEIEGTLDEMSNDKVTSHRVITETGDIIDTSMLLQSPSKESEVEQPIVKEPTKTKEKSVKDSKKSKRVVVVDKFCDTFVKNIKEPDESNGPFHKVVIKEIRTDKGQNLKVFNCIACNVYVTGLEDFKSYPCNILKYSCPHCPVTYNNMASVCGHMKTHSKSKTDGTSAPTDFECEICSTKLKTHKSLKLHKRMHDPVKIRPIEPPVEGADGGTASEDTYLCSECNKDIPIDYRTVHDNSHKSEQKFNCDICNKKFTSGEYLDMHMTVHNNDKVPLLKEQCYQYVCLYCDSRFANQHDKVKHERSHTADGTSVATDFECGICSIQFKTHKSLKLHKRMHDPVKIRPIEPPVEGADGGTASEDTYLCVECNKDIPIDYRTIHDNSHKSEQKYNCDICNKKFTSGEYLDMHMTVHNNDKVPVSKQEKCHQYVCLYCDRRFAKPHEKVKHERIHTGEKPHSCEICGKSFRVSYCLTLHMRTHTGARPYSCPHCGKRFKAHSVYNHHLLTHSDVRAYKCPFCPKAFKTSVQLAGHKNSHTKPFSCQHCNRPFASLYAVRAHMETHSRQNNLRFSCSLCGASYARVFALKDHMLQVHNKVDSPKFSEEKIKELKSGATLTTQIIETDTEDTSTMDKLTQDIEITDLELMNSNELTVP